MLCLNFCNAHILSIQCHADTDLHIRKYSLINVVLITCNKSCKNQFCSLPFVAPLLDILLNFLILDVKL
jgi:hypothetical protein